LEGWYAATLDGASATKLIAPPGLSVTEFKVGGLSGAIDPPQPVPRSAADVGYGVNPHQVWAKHFVSEQVRVTTGSHPAVGPLHWAAEVRTGSNALDGSSDGGNEPIFEIGVNPGVVTSGLDKLTSGQTMK
jgi:hypothetical protein